MNDIADVNIRRLDGTLLLVFRELMRQRRATVAAARLGLSQSGVSHALARLRDVFGDPLFLRRPHGLEPTRRALELAPRIEALIALAQDAVGGEARFDPARSTRQFHVGGAEFLIPLIAAPLLRRMEREAPNASVVFRFVVGEAAVGALQRGEIDVALGQFGAAPETVRREPMFTDHYAIVARKGHPALQGEVDVKLFSELGHVMVSPTGDTTGLVDPSLAAMGVRRRVVAVVPRFLTAFAVVAATDAVLFAPRPLALRYADGFGLMIIPTAFPGLTLEVSAIRRLDTPGDPGASWLLDHIREAIAVEDRDSGVRLVAG
jgi:DNA-binding transcriptional LysR family regulator